MFAIRSRSARIWSKGAYREAASSIIDVHAAMPSVRSDSNVDGPRQWPLGTGKDFSARLLASISDRSFIPFSEKNIILAPWFVRFWTDESFWRINRASNAEL